MNFGLQGKLAVVTGSTAGIGFSIAATLAQEGGRVVINGRTQTRVDNALEKLRQANRGAEFTGVAADLSTVSGVDAFLKAVPVCDILINNLGIFEVKPFLEITDSDWQRFFDTNILSGVRLSRHYLSNMLKKNWGRIIFISSESAQQIPKEMVHYGVTKTAQVALASGIARSVAKTGVTANTILAGPTASEGVETFLRDVARQQGISPAEMEKQFFTTARGTSLLQRFETPEEIAAVVAFVASTQAAIINGAAIRAEGGVVLSIF
ncbi:MAG: SDR family NAD(P)-dependent oxidoreductase [Candidatus Acidiferrum sp.]